MIQRKNENWFRLLFVWRGSVLPQILPRLTLLFILSVVIVFFNGELFSHKVPLNPAPFTLFGIALALFLGFRNNASYDRFWEGRKLWGALLNDTRSLARKCITMSGYSIDDKETTLFINYLIAFTYALKHQLRYTDASADMHQWLPEEFANSLEDVKYKPIIIMKAMGQWVQTAREEKKIDSIVQVSFDESFSRLSDIVGGCERLASTPIPYTYKVMLHRTVYLYCLLVPFGFVDSLGWMTPIVTIFIAYTFVALEAIADEIEIPFGTQPNDLALNAMSKTIETSLLEMAERPITPEPANDSLFID
ncbi:bestrophin family protein [Mucilaginibacter sp. X4EP1]|uniref:bestrophin family protein n=1 Tax=Mucilaginibacter sp. X4EP1 TaxID=2723092 RepID=UPI0021689ED0|nr:bestrophin family ion channel [Mucilaginibacter sp. X4EP1]MCS3812467.1 putative membrane protein [Mucilaginibacter sp. X4EP1]